MPHELDGAYRRTFARLKGLFRAWGCSPEEAADLAQEAAIRAYTHVRRAGVTGDGLDPLINRIARNLLIDRHRRVAPHLVPIESAEDVSDPGADPTEEIIRRQRRHAVRSAVRELPSRHQTAILYSMHGMSPAEVGDRLGIGRNAADALLHRARRSLRERLRQVGEGALSAVLWVRVRATGRGRIAPIEAAGSATLPATVAAVAAFVVAVGIAAPGGLGSGDAGAQARPTSAVALGALPAFGGAGAGGAGDATSGFKEIGVGDASFGKGGGYVFKGKAKVSDPKDADRPILDVGPSVVHEDNSQSAVGDAAGKACNGREYACYALYQDPIDGDG